MNNKVSENIESTGKQYELKQEYLDDLVRKLDARKSNVFNSRKIAIIALLLLLLGGVMCLLNSGKSEIKHPIEVTSATLILENFTNNNNLKFSEAQNRASLLDSLTVDIDELWKQFEPVERDYGFLTLYEDHISLGIADSSIQEFDKNLLSDTELNSETRTSELFKPKKGEELVKESLNNETEKEQQDSLAKIDPRISEIKNDTANSQFFTSLTKKPGKNETLSDNEKHNTVNNKKNVISDTIGNESVPQLTNDSTKKQIISERADSLVIVGDTTKLSEIIDSSLKVIKPNFTGKRWQVSGLVGANSSFSILKNANNPTYLEKRKARELPLTTFTGGILVEKFISNSVKLTSGISFGKYGSNNPYIPLSVNENRNTFVGLDTVYSSNIDSIFYRPTSTWMPYLIQMDTSVDSSYALVATPRTDSNGFKNRGIVSFSYVEIPVMIGVYKQINNWNVGLNTGVSIGLLTKSEGFYLDESLTSVTKAQSQQWMVNYLLSPELNYVVNDTYYFGIQPFFKLGLNNLSLSEPLDRKYFNLQFNAKIGMRF